MKLDRSDAGFSLSALIFFLAAASIFIAAAVPAYQMQAKREMEEELIFRGEEYTRAIQKYQRKFGVYPTSIDQLVSTNGLRFLRRAYKDPMTEKSFRFILVNPDGSLTGSKLFTQNTTNQSLFGDTQPFGQNSSQQTSPFQQQQRHHSSNNKRHHCSNSKRHHCSNKVSLFHNKRQVCVVSRIHSVAPRIMHLERGHLERGQPAVACSKDNATRSNRVGRATRSVLLL